MTLSMLERFRAMRAIHAVLLNTAHDFFDNPDDIHALSVYCNAYRPVDDATEDNIVAVISQIMLDTQENDVYLRGLKLLNRTM